MVPPMYNFQMDNALRTAYEKATNVKESGHTEHRNSCLPVPEHSCRAIELSDCHITNYFTAISVCYASFDSVYTRTIRHLLQQNEMSARHPLLRLRLTGNQRRLRR
ncbi:hypothetical protein TNCV_1685811 [Trichonephila clavipes]|nr:hypothetical protein TNCV_1685811 [Trichonephila clavipes]